MGNSHFRRILLVEDNRDDELLTVRALSRGQLNIFIDVVRDGADALDFLFRKGKYADLEDQALPSLILLDLMLPKIDGLGVLKRLRAEDSTKNIPVIALTSGDDHTNIMSSYVLGVNSFIKKPVDIKAFSQVIEQIGLYWLSINEIPASRN